jgi:hypothetical protein
MANPCGVTFLLLGKNYKLLKTNLLSQITYVVVFKNAIYFDSMLEMAIVCYFLLAQATTLSTKKKQYIKVEQHVLTSFS